MGFYDIYKAQLLSGNSGGSGGDTAILDALIDRSITEISGNVTSIGNHAFNNCSSLTTVEFPLVTKIGIYAFGSCSKLTTVDLPLVTTIGNNAFNSCSSLTTVEFPLVTKIDFGTFGGCSKLATVALPLVTTISDNAFNSCSSLTTVEFPLVTSIASYAFNYCSKLTTVDLPLVTTIGNNAFSGCSELKTLILRSSGICKLSVANSFNSTLIANGTGYIYVPSALIESYKTAANWSTYAAQFRALEDYTVDGTATGALDETKI